MNFADIKDDLPWADEQPAAQPKQGRPLQRAVAAPVPERGQLGGMNDVVRFVQAGKATMTFVSKKTGARFTFRFARPEPVPGQRRPTWVSLMSGPDNESSYEFLGTVWEDLSWGLTYKHSFKSRVKESAPSVVALKWLVAQLGGVLRGQESRLLEQAEVWHEGRCARCGRKLTVPESIATGFGPECATK